MSSNLRLVVTRLFLLFAGALLCNIRISAQCVPLKEITDKLNQGRHPGAADFGFLSYNIPLKTDTIHFYTYQKGTKTPTSIYMYLPGSEAADIYTWHAEGDSSFWFSSLTSFDFSFMPEDYLFVIVAKPGYGFSGRSHADSIPATYWEKTSLQDRVRRANTALNFVKRKIVKRPKNVVVFGYSEGFYVAAKLGTINKSITHLGIGGGGGYIDFYDFILQNEAAAHRFEIDPDSAHAYSQDLINTWRRVMLYPVSDSMSLGYSNKRWASFSEPPMQLLSSLHIPIYQIHGAMDECTPLESAFLVPLEFTRLKKENLTFRVYPKCNHSLIEIRPDGTEIMHQNDMMIEFFNWVNAN